MQGSDGLPTGPEASEAIHVDPRHLRFAPELEAEFRKASGPMTGQIMRHILIIQAGLGISMIWGAFLTDMLAVWVTAIGELLVNLPVTIAVVLLLRSQVLHWRHEAFFLLATIVRVVCTTAEGHWEILDHANRYVMAGGLELFCSLIVVPLRLPQAVRFIAVVYPLYVLAAMLPFDAMARSTWDMAVFVGLLLPVGLRVRFRFERSERISFLLSARDRARVRELARANERLHVLSDTDPLTGVGNRRTFDRTLKRVVAAGAGLGLLMIDADYFKRYNDSQGHLQGDECLRQLARTMREAVRATDHVARYGGEEFAVILPAASVSEVVEVAERIRHGVLALMLPHHARPDDLQVVSISIGAALAAAGQPVTPAQLAGQADEALYAAKESGRNRLRCFGINTMVVAPTASI